MAKATLTLRNGTVVVIEGAADEVSGLLTKFDGSGSGAGSAAESLPAAQKSPGAKSAAPISTSPDSLGLHEIVNAAKDCKESAAIESQILDKASQLNRVLLPLYVAQEHAKVQHGLTMPEIAGVLEELRSPVAGPNVAKVIRNIGSGYVMADGPKKAGATRRFRLSRRGYQHIRSLLFPAAASK